MAHSVQRKVADGRQIGRCPPTTKPKQESIMKKILSIVAGLVLTTGLALAQNGPGSGSQSNYYSHSWSNDNNYLWGTNCLTLTNVPAAWSNKVAHAYAGQSQAGGGGQVQNRFGQPELPADVQSVVQQFEQDRTRLMSQLKTCSDEQRQQILQEMEQMRTQLRDQVCQFREQAQQQAEQMRNRLGNNRDRILDQGAGSTGSGRDR